ncbi:trypsin-like peptidase domain-containing protein [Vibrio owensii]|uniref:trypsin-like peptidase domain-containing protein n=1 Tax=Vibrio owensii TaxID=696485 RepID=UPI0018F19E83|nr:trypsin-like peptidase domain-containing protein [Vibrio owensii]
MSVETVQIASLRSLYIEMFYNDTKLLKGTAFVVEKDGFVYLVTNRHNVTGVANDGSGKVIHKSGGVPNKIKIYCVKEQTKQSHGGLFQEFNLGDIGEWVTKVQDLYAEENEPGLSDIKWIEHPIHGEKADFVALKIEDTSGAFFHPYDLNPKPCDKFRIPEKIYVVGFPFGKSVAGKFALWSGGTVASEPDFDFEDLPCVLIDCRSRQGQSGSPVIRHLPHQSPSPYGNGFQVIDDNSDLLGIYSGRINEKSDLGRVWKRHAIKELIDSIET